MPIYDSDGSANREIGKIYDNNGSANTQTGKVYDSDGSANRLIYNSELVLFDGKTLAPGYSLWKWAKSNATDWNTSIAGLWWAKARYNQAGSWSEPAQAGVVINGRNFSKITITYNTVQAAYGSAQIIVRREDNNTQLRKWQDSGTKTIDISSINSNINIFCDTYNTQGNQTDAVITRVVLE